MPRTSGAPFPARRHLGRPDAGPHPTERMKEQSPRSRLSGFLAKFPPGVRSVARATLRKMRERLPGSVELVYDNYNALAIGFSPTDRVSDAAFSVAVYPRWVSLFFLQGASLPDPDRVLRGTGKKVRHVVLASASMIDTPEVQSLIATAVSRAAVPFDPKARRRLIIKSVSAKQRPRRPT